MKGCTAQDRRSPSMKVSAFHLENWARLSPLQTQGCPLANLTSYTRLDCTDELELKLFVSQIHISHFTGESPKATDDSEQQTFTRLACWNCARLNQRNRKHLNRTYSCSSNPSCSKTPFIRQLPHSHPSAWAVNNAYQARGCTVEVEACSR